MQNESHSTPRGGLLSMRHADCREMRANQWIRVWSWYILSIAIYFGFQNLEHLIDSNDCSHTLCWKKPIPFRTGWSTPLHELSLSYWILSNLVSVILLFLFLVLWETMIDRMSRQRRCVKALSNLIIRNTNSEYIEFDYIDNVLSWLALEDFVKRKGMLLFASMETPLFALFLLALVSWGSAIGCLFKIKGLTWTKADFLFSNSALAAWGYLALLSLYQVIRMLWEGHLFHSESNKQNNGISFLFAVFNYICTESIASSAIKSQCGTIHENNLMQFLKHDPMTKEQQYSHRNTQKLLTHLKIENDIVPEVCFIVYLLAIATDNIIPSHFE